MEEVRTEIARLRVRVAILELLCQHLFRAQPLQARQDLILALDASLVKFREVHPEDTLALGSAFDELRQALL